MKQVFADNVRELRKGKNLTQTELAKKLWVNKSIISAYENQQRMPSIDILIKLSYEFGVSIEYLLGIEKNKTIDISGLTEKQATIVTQIIKMFEEENQKED